MASNYRFKVKTGETKTFTATLTDGNDDPINLDDKDVFFTMTRNGSTVLSLQACTPDPNQTTNTGVVRYEIASAVTSTLTKGEYDGEFAVVDEMGKTLFYPNDFTDERDYIKVIVSLSKAIPV
jgi:hypothetical protein